MHQDTLYPSPEEIEAILRRASLARSQILRTILLRIRAKIFGHHHGAQAAAKYA